MIKRALLSILRGHLRRIKAWRRRKFLMHLYQLHRDNYYAHATRLAIPNNKKVSILVPCFNTPAKYFDPLLSSIFAQGYANWELVLVDASTKKEHSQYLSNKAETDVRIVYKKTNNEGIAKNTNKALGFATGDYIAFLDHDDTLDPDALAESVAVLETHKEFGLVYSDEDKISDDGERYFNPHYKPGFSLDMLRNLNYITHFVVVRKEIADNLGGIRPGFDGAQDFDFLLRVADEGIKFAHIPKVLYHWREAEGSTAADFSSKKNVLEAGCRALDDHYKRNGINNVKNHAIVDRPGYYKPKYKLDDRKRAIIFDLSNTNLSTKEIDYIISQYRDIEEVKKNEIKIELNVNSYDKFDTVMLITQPIIPLKNKTEIVSMFGVAEQKDVVAVMPMITKHGRIYNMGNVLAGLESKKLFEDVAADRNDFFGSLEWVRNVDEIDSGIKIRSTLGSSNGGRYVVWSHAEYSIIDTGDRNEGKRNRRELTGFYNPNVSNVVNTTQRITDYITDKIEEQP